MTCYEKVLQHIRYIAAQNRLDVIQCGEPSAQDNSPVQPDFEIPNQCCSGPLPLLYSRLQAIEQAACADFALLSCLVSAAAAKNQSEFYIFGVASAAEQ